MFSQKCVNLYIFFILLNKSGNVFYNQDCKVIFFFFLTSLLKTAAQFSPVKKEIIVQTQGIKKTH